MGCSQAAGSMYKNKNSDMSIINVSSGAALQGGGSGIGYNAAKARSLFFVA
jgi:NAD(P)-dependent dehydrogenase (short-subunit alcohol dehydrogenase family)